MRKTIVNEEYNQIAELKDKINILKKIISKLDVEKFNDMDPAIATKMAKTIDDLANSVETYLVRG